ncbi:hypothetical protein E2P81_ATG05216 [Venturia nashicola]|nr:hypothetical protein E2P81_ATG05216 [Venturia nashicola]
MAPPSTRDVVITGLLAFVCMADLVRGKSMSGTVTLVTWTYNASSTIATTVDINTNGTGTAYAFACNAATQSYNQATSTFMMDRSTAVFPTFTTSYEYTSAFWDTYTVDCQNITHAHGTTPLSSYVYYNTTTFINYTSTASSTYPGPSPSCRIEPDDCKAVQSSFSKENAAFNKFTSLYTPPYDVVNPPVTPACSTVCTAKPMCMIKGDHVKVIYWPVTTTGANSCRSNGTTVPPTVTGIQTIQALGTTFTSPSVYLSFQSLSAYDWGCYKKIGEGVSNTIIALPPESLSSAVGWHLGRSAVPYNLADLNGYVSSAAFFRMQGYDWSGPRMTIFDDLYAPSVWMPDAVLTMRPEWSTCVISDFGVNDPPLALNSVEFLTLEAPAAPTVTSKPDNATPVAMPSYTNAPQTTPPALQDQDPSRGQDSPKENLPATEPAGNDSVPPGPTSATSYANIGDIIASVIGYTKPEPPEPEPPEPQPPEPQPATAITITTVKIITIVSNGFVDGDKTMPVSALLPSAQIPPTFVDPQLHTNSSGSTPSAQIPPTFVDPQLHTNSSGSTYVIIAGSPVYVGSSIVVGSHNVKVDSTGIIVDGTQTVSYATAPTIAAGTAQAIEYQVAATTDPSGQTVVVVGNQTLSVAGSAMTIDGHTLSAQSNGIVVDGNGTTIPYATATATGLDGVTGSNETNTTSSTSSIAFSTDSEFAPSVAASPKSKSSASYLQASRSLTVKHFIFVIGVLYGLR